MVVRTGPEIKTIEQFKRLKDETAFERYRSCYDGVNMLKKEVYAERSVSLDLRKKLKEANLENDRLKNLLRFKGQSLTCITVKYM